MHTISEQLLADLQQGYTSKMNANGQSVQELFAEEKKFLLPLPAAAFEVSKVVLVSVTSRATVQIEKAIYSVPSTWARLEATAYVGVEAIRLTCLGQEVLLKKEPPHVTHDQVSRLSS